MIASLRGFVLGTLSAMLAVAAFIGISDSYSIYFVDKSWPVDPSVRYGDLQAELEGSELSLSETRLTAAFSQWNAVSGSAWDVSGYIGQAGSVVWTGSSCTTAAWQNITIVSYNISPLGSEATCSSGANITRSVIRLDFRNWDNDGGSVGTNEFDLQGLLVHELGHSAGWGEGSATDHFSGSTTCPGGSSNHSMCGSMGMGQPHVRTLESHDQHTIANFY